MRTVRGYYEDSRRILGRELEGNVRTVRKVGGHLENSKCSVREQYRFIRN